MQPSGIPHVDEPTGQLHERILDEVLRELAIAGEQVRESAGIGRVPLEQLYEEPTLELDLSDLHPRALSCPPFSNARRGRRVDASKRRSLRHPVCFNAERVHEVDTTVSGRPSARQRVDGR